MKNTHIKKMVLSAMFIAIGIVLPFLTGQISLIGNMMLPMHIPVLLCGLICGWQYGLSVGFILPILRSFWLGMPRMYPTAISMALELATYGFVIGFLYSSAKWQCTRSLYRCMLIAMVSGRVVWGVAQVMLLGIGTNGFTLQAFISGAFTNAVPGIVIQLVLIPAIMVALNKAKLVPFRKKADEKKAYGTE